MKFGELKGYEVKGQQVLLDFDGRSAVITVVTPKIINVFCGLEDDCHRSHAIEGNKQQPAELIVERCRDGLWITTEKVKVRVCDGFYVDFFDMEREPVCEDYRGRRRQLKRISDEMFKLLASEGHEALRQEPMAFEVVKRLQGSEHFYGLGDKTGFLDKRHYDYEMWNTDNANPHVDSFRAL